MRNEEKKTFAIEAEPNLPAGHPARGHQGPPLADVLLELGYDDVWVAPSAIDSGWLAPRAPEADEMRLALYALGRGFDCML